MPYPVSLAILAAAVAAPPENSIVPRTVTWHQSNPTPVAEVLRAVEAQSGLRVTAAAGLPAVSVTLDKSEAWGAVETLALATQSRIARRDGGRRAELVPSARPAPPSFVSGAFRVELERVTASLDFVTGRRVVELHLALHWEPRLAVVRAEGQPVIEVAETDAGEKAASARDGTRVAVSGAEYLCTLPLTGVPRAAKRLEKITGAFHVTAADEMLAFDFGELTGAPVRREQKGVRAAVTRSAPVGDRREVAVELVYPEGTPLFESFESFTAGNEARLGGAAPADSEVSENGRRSAAVYRFPASAGGRFTLTTPGPLREVRVPWELRGVELP